MDYFTWEDETTEQPKIERLRSDYRRYGLSIFESFEEYCSDKLEYDEN